MRNELSTLMRAAVDEGDGRGFDTERSRRVLRSVTWRRTARTAVAGAGATVAVGALAVTATAIGRLDLRPGAVVSPSPAPAASGSPSPSAQPSPSPVVGETARPSDTEVFRVMGAEPAPVQCGMDLATLASASLQITSAEEASPSEFADIVAAVQQEAGQQEDGTPAYTEAAQLAIHGDLRVAVWDPSFLSSLPRREGHSGTISFSGLEEGWGNGAWANWDGRVISETDEGAFKQIWGGYVVLEGTTVVGQGRHGRATPDGSGVISASVHTDSAGAPVGGYVLVARPWDAVAWCPGVQPGNDGRSIAAIVSVRIYDGDPVYGWRVFDER